MASETPRARSNPPPTKLRALGARSESLPRLTEHPEEVEALLRGLDLGLSALVFIGVAHGFAGPDVAFHEVLVLCIASSLVWPVALRQLNAYSVASLHLDLWAVFSRLGTAGLTSTTVLAALAFALSAPVAAVFPLVCGAAQLLALASVRLSILALLRWLRRSGRATHHVLIVGCGPRAAYVKEVIERSSSWGMEVIGFVDDARPPSGPAVPEERISKLAEMPELLRDCVVDEVIVACPRQMLGSIIAVVDAAAAAGVPVTLLSDLFGDYLPPPRVKRFGSLPALRFAPVHHNVLRLVTKRAVDFVGSAALLGLSAPIIVLSALLVKASSQGPAFFRQTRCTRNGRPFVMIKLRTMYVDAEERREEVERFNEMDGPVFKARRDPRVTPIGRLLRRFSIDELPQFWNVLLGDMSLVGPRPPIPSEVLQYQTFERRRLSMRPGITCLWQVSGRNEIGFEDWVRLDLEYIDTWSLSGDFLILLRTIPAVLRGTGS